MPDVTRDVVACRKYSKYPAMSRSQLKMSITCNVCHRLNPKPVLLSLYSTRTQTHSRWGFALGTTPKRGVRIADTNIAVSKKPCRPNVNRRRPNANRREPTRTQHKPMEYTSHWVHEGCIFQVFVSLFVCVGHQTQTLFLVKYRF